MTAIDTISTTVRRRYILGKQGLWPGRHWAGKDGTADALRAVEAVQIDPVSVVAPSHDIVLWGRVHGYQPQYLDSHMYAERRFFDYGGGLMIYPMEELPYWRVMMERRKSDKRWADFAQANPALLDQVRQEIRARGPLRNRDIEGKSVDHYRASKDTGVALYYLWLTGELMTHNRQGRERVYDLIENVAPVDLMWSATREDAVEFFTRKAVSHRGLVSERGFRNILKSASGRPVGLGEARTRLAEMVEAGQLASVRFEGQAAPLYYLAADAALLVDLCDGNVPADWRPIQATTTAVTFFSPLEYVSARGRAKKLFGFDYIWEIYKPEPKRQYGPYTMPILYGDQLVARLDAKLERQDEKLLINGLWVEDWFAPDDIFALALAEGLSSFATFLGANRLDTASLVPHSLRVLVNEHLISNGMICV